MFVSPVHQFLGESLITLSIVGLLITLFLKESGGGMHRASLIALRIWVILLSVQWLLGVITYFAYPAGARPSLAHPLLMTAVVAAAHMLAGKVRKAPETGRNLAMGAFADAAVLMWIGIQLV